MLACEETVRVMRHEEDSVPSRWPRRRQAKGGKHPGRYLVLGVISAGLALIAGQSWWMALCAFFIGPAAILLLA